MCSQLGSKKAKVGDPSYSDYGVVLSTQLGISSCPSLFLPRPIFPQYPVSVCDDLLEARCCTL